MKVWASCIVDEPGVRISAVCQLQRSCTSYWEVSGLVTGEEVVVHSNTSETDIEYIASSILSELKGDMITYGAKESRDVLQLYNYYL